MTDPKLEAGLGSPRLGEKRQLSERVAAYLREAIMVGELPTTGYVRTEHLAARLGVSATPVREALMILQSEGAVRWEPRRGFRMLPPTRQDVDDLFNVQAYVAGELAARAVSGLDASEVAALRATQDALVDAVLRGETERVGELNHQVHRTINRAAGSPRLSSLLNLFVHYVPRNYYDRVAGWADASRRDHEAILAALEAGDPEAARAAMVEHIENIGRLLIAHLDRTGAFTRTELSPDGTPAAG